MTAHRLPSRKERKAEFRRRGLPFQPLYGGRSMQAPLNVVLGKIEHINLGNRRTVGPTGLIIQTTTTGCTPESSGTDPQPSPPANGDVTGPER